MMLLSGTVAVWIGATDDIEEEVWHWPDNSTINFGKTSYGYTNWKTTPSYDVTINCAEKTTAGTWSPATCSTKK